jgi:hypothetical protein
LSVNGVHLALCAAAPFRTLDKARTAWESIGS